MAKRPQARKNGMWNMDYGKLNRLFTAVLADPDQPINRPNPTFTAVIPRERLVIHAVTKNACSSTFERVRCELQNRSFSIADPLPFKPFLHTGEEALSLYPDYRHVAITRHPLKRFLSGFISQTNSLRLSIPVEAYIRCLRFAPPMYWNVHVRPQHYMIAEGVETCDIGDLESWDVNVLKGLPRRNTAKRKPPPLSDEMKNILEPAYAVDCERFGYNYGDV